MRFKHTRVIINNCGNTLVFGLDNDEFDALIKEYPKQYRSTEQTQWVEIGTVTFFKDKK